MELSPFLEKTQWPTNWQVSVLKIDDIDYIAPCHILILTIPVMQTYFQDPSWIVQEAEYDFIASEEAKKK